MNDSIGSDFTHTMSPKSHINNDKQETFPIEKQFFNNTEERKENTINLVNFDPLNLSKKINSPRSLEVCLRNGINPIDLYHKSYDSIKEICPPLQRTNNKYVKMKYIDYENRRAILLKRLLNLRKQMIYEGPRRSNTAAHSYDTRYNIRQAKFNKMSTCSLDLIKRKFRSTKEFNTKLLVQEQKRAIATTAKELQNIVGQVKREDFVDTCTYNEGLKQHSSHKVLKSLAKGNTDRLKTPKDYKYIVKRMIRSREKKISQYINNKQSKMDIWRRSQTQLNNNKRLAMQIHFENDNEKKQLVKRMEEYKRQKLLEKIRKHDEKSQSIQSQRNTVCKLRQEMRKNAINNKFKAKQEIEKVIRKYNRAQINENIMGEMFEAAGLGKIWQIVNCQ